jgi:hypothetical protein
MFLYYLGRIEVSIDKGAGGAFVLLPHKATQTEYLGKDQLR